MRRLPDTVYNPLSLIGAGIALVTFGSIIVFFLMDVLGVNQSPYMGIFTYMILPGIMVFGLFLIPAGIFFERRRRRKSEGAPRKYITLDLNEPRHRMAVMIFTVGTMLLIVVSAAGTYQAYTYSESVEFCGEVCHEPMHPEYTAYQHSAHARVACAECHIGSGADWFVKAKISGMYQVYSVLFDKYHRPIETPIRNLRPARETCEECHWPDKFSGQKKLTKVYFPLDTSETEPWILEMDIKIGGGQSELGPTEGIHWHMNAAQTLDYIAIDEKRQVIPWVKSVNLKGETRIFRSTDHTLSDQELASFETRRMDCMDCHNRPSHIYHPPFRTINDAMALGRIDPALPNIRSIASAAMTREYASAKQAELEIPRYIRSEYRIAAPHVLKRQETALEQSIQEVLRIYKRNFFPEMNVSWKEYPTNIGHMYNAGCFRCHDNKHIADDGTVISNDCTVCHTIIEQGPVSNPVSSLSGMEFRHPAEIEDAWKTVNCSNCHLGI